jgi:cell division transport system permease protein
MTKKRNKTRNRHGMQVLTLCISTTLVLILLGLVVFSVLTTHNLSNYVKENLTVTVMLGDDMSVNEGHMLCRDLYHRHICSHIDYISKDDALKEQTKAMGTDPSEFIGANPFVATLELHMKSEYANRDSLKWISAELKRMPKVTDVNYQEGLMDSVNNNLQKISVVLLVLAVLLAFVSFSLISNTVRLGVYAHRFSIRTMKLVGASWKFIRAPFLNQSITIGVIAAFVADIVLACGVFFLYDYEPGIINVVTWQVMTITGLSVVFFGIVISMFCTYLSVNKFLKMKAGELYKI